jgi:phospholipase C
MCGEKVYTAPPLAKPVAMAPQPAYDAIKGSPGILTGSAGTTSCGTGVLPAGVFNDRCGFGVRLPFLVISHLAKRNYVDHSLNDTTSMLRFIEYNWGLGTIGDPQSFDVLASGTILGMFDFDQDPDDAPLILDRTTGQVIRGPSR